MLTVPTSFCLGERRASAVAASGAKLLRANPEYAAFTADLEERGRRGTSDGGARRLRDGPA